MIAPAVTCWPANTFTPSRCACESRPFFDEPRPFLCAIARVLLLRPRPPRLRRRLLGGVGLRLRRGPRLRGRLRLGLRLRRRRLRLGLLRLRLARRCPLRPGRAADRLDRDPGQLRPMPARPLVAALRLELEHLDLLAPQMLDDLHRDGALELGAVGDHVVAARHQDVGRERLAGGMRLPVDEELLALLDPVLLAADLDDRIHEPRNGTRAPRPLSYPGSFPAGRACARPRRCRRRPWRRQREPAPGPDRARAPPRQRPPWSSSWPAPAAASAAWEPGPRRPRGDPRAPAPRRPRAARRGPPRHRRAPRRRPTPQRSTSTGRGHRACRAGASWSPSPRRPRPPWRRPRRHRPPPPRRAPPRPWPRRP